MRERDKYECYGKGDPGQRSGGRYPPEWRKALINAAQEQALRLGSNHTPAIIDEEGQW